MRFPRSCPAALSPFLVAAALIVGLLVGVQPVSANGCITPAAGTAGDPYLITNVTNLNCLKDEYAYYWHHGYHFRQTADIDMAASPWTNGIGDDSDTFNGTYDGNGFTISNLTVTDDTKVGLFGVTEGATLTDITLVDVTVTGTGTVAPDPYTYVGGLVGQARAGTTITNSVTSGSITSYGYSAGGLVGEAGSGTVITGSSSSASVAFSFYTGSIAGGLVGNGDLADGDLTITDSFATGSVSGFGSIGGLVGAVKAPATIRRSYATGDSAAALGDVGGLLGRESTDDTAVVVVDQSFAVGDVSTANGAAGGLIGSAGNSAVSQYSELTVSDSYATGSVTTGSVLAPAGGLVGSAYTAAGHGVTLTRTYATGTVLRASTAPGGGILADVTNPADAVIASSFWNPTDSGAGATSAYGTQTTQGAMRSPSLYSSAGWSISDTAPAGTTWVSCAAYNSGYPFLSWYGATQGWACSPPPPPPPPTYPPSAPLDVVGVAGDKSVTVSWSAPASSGSFAVTNYQVRGTPGGTCLVTVTTCEISGLPNGTAYTFEVQALNGVGWSPWSTPSGSVTPGPPPPPPTEPTIVITGSRAEVRGKPGIVVQGTTTDFGVGAILRPWVKFPGRTSYSEGSASILVDAGGGFTWHRRTGKKIYIIIKSEDGSVKSNRLIIDR